MHDAHQATLLSSANSFSDSEDLALEVGEVQRPLEEEKSTLVISAWDRDTWDKLSFHRGELELDDRSSSSPLQGRRKYVTRPLKASLRDLRYPPYVRELWRLRLNFFVLLVLSFTGGIGYSAVLSSLHQFVINPTVEELNGTVKIPPGLGRSEFFYSWTITIYSLGEVIMAPLAGYSTRIIPYWYILATGVLMQTFGYIIYAVASGGWMLLLARLLTGGYSGIIETISYSYVSEKEQDYREAYFQVHKQDLDKKNGRLKLPNMKEKVFSLLTIVVAFAYLLGPGMSALIAQFPSVNQFRWVGWLLVVLGAFSLLFMLTLFHGEMKTECRKVSKRSSKHSSKQSSSDNKRRSCNPLKRLTLVRTTVLLFFIAASYVMDSSYGVVDTLFNPILSDYFGFTEKETSYFFLGVMTIHVVGSLLLLLLNLLRLNTRVIAILGVLASVAGAALIADWQSIGNDPCTRFSPFHDPEVPEPLNFTLTSQQANGSIEQQLLMSRLLTVHASLQHQVKRHDNLEYATPFTAVDKRPCQNVDFHASIIKSQIESMFGPLTSKRVFSGVGLRDSDTQVPNDVVSLPSLSCVRDATSGKTCPRCRDWNPAGCLFFKVTSDDLCFQMEARGKVSNLSHPDIVSLCKGTRYPIHVCISAWNSVSVPTSEFVQFKQAAELLTKAVVIHSVQRVNRTGGEGNAVGETNNVGQGENLTATSPGGRGSATGRANNATVISPGDGGSSARGKNITVVSPGDMNGSEQKENVTAVNATATNPGDMNGSGQDENITSTNATATNPGDMNGSGEEENMTVIDPGLGQDNTPASPHLDLSAQPEYGCEALAPPQYKCYWNQHSRVTGEVCFECPPICRSEYKSLDFIQYCIGVAIFVLTIPISRVVLMVLISNSLSKEDQGPFTGIVVAAGGISRTVSPIWIDAAYEGVQKRTFLSMTIKIANFIPILIGLFALYRLLEPQETTNEVSEDPSKEEQETDIPEEDEEKVQLLEKETHHSSTS